PTVFCFNARRRPPAPPSFPTRTLFRSDAAPPIALIPPAPPPPPLPSARSPASIAVMRARSPELRPRLKLMCRGRVRTASCVSKRSEEHTSELQSRENLVCRLLLEKKKK